ncbi:MAG TPA: hypothetical protein GX398_03800 [Candidatus Cloacimonetes bacterium]|nr:hypothetical protein [Candidatus Cloacimonadota bacterium]
MKPVYYLFAIALALTLFSCASTQEHIAGTVNGQAIPMDQFASSHRGHYENFYILNERGPSMEEKNEIIKLTWKDITKHVILQQQFRRFNITSSLQEALDTLHINPPVYIVSSPRFQKDGVFDRALFVQALRYDQSEEIQAVIRQYRDYYVPIAKLKQKLIRKELMTSRDKKLIKNVLNAVVDLELISIDPSLKEVSIKNEDIQFYYDTNPGKFALEPKYSVAYGYLRLDASEEDISLCQAHADTLYQLLQKGADPAELIKKPTYKDRQVSWAQSGFMRISDMDQKLYVQLCQIKAGQYLPPYTQPGSTAIHRLDQMTKSMISYSTMKIPHLPGSETVDRDKARALQSAMLLETIGYEATEHELDLQFTIKKNIPFNSQWQLDTPDNRPNEEEMLKTLRKGYVPEPVFSYEQSGWLLMQVTDVMPLTRKPVAEVADQIRRIITKAKAHDYALKDAQYAILNNSFTSLKNQVETKSQLLTAQSIDHMDAELLDKNMLFESILGKLRNEEPKAYQKDGLIVVPLVQNIKYRKQKVDNTNLYLYFEKSLPADWFDQWMNEQVKKAKIVYKI